MRILMLSWEYPPKNVGGLSTHVYHLTHSLAAQGHEVHLVTCEEGIAPSEELDRGVYVYRVLPYPIETDDFTKWIIHLNFAMIERASALILKLGSFDVIHAHDWLSAFSARALKWSFHIPLVSTIHATEYGRNGGIRTELQRYISSTEELLCYESWKVITCSNYMRTEVNGLFHTQWDKLWVIPNAVDTKEFNIDFDWLQFRRRYASDDEKIVFYIGRHVFEKGIHLLIEAAPQIVSGFNKTRFIIAGKGPMTDELKQRVRYLGLADKFTFTGYMDDDSRNKLYKVANVAVFPSLYEPFGIVALEAMSAGCPVVVSDTGGLSEIVVHEKTGLKSLLGIPQSIGDNILRILKDEGLSNAIIDGAYREIFEKYTWDKIAETTGRMYNMVLNEAEGTMWRKKFN